MSSPVVSVVIPTYNRAPTLRRVLEAFERQRPVAFGLFVAGLALSKENLVLYALALCLTLAVGQPARKKVPLAATGLCS